MSKFADGIWRLIENCAIWILKLCFKLVHKTPTEQNCSAFLQFVKFGVVGVSNTLISWVLYTLSLLAFHQLEILKNIDFIVAQVISFVLSVLWSFYWNNKKVFVKDEGQERSMWKSLLKTYVSYSFTGLFLSSALLVLWVRVLHISEFIAPFFNLLITVPLNFVINKFWAFK